jgi:hypothetical protein
MSVYDDLTAGVAETTTVEASAIQLLDNIAAQLQASIVAGVANTAAVQAVIGSLQTSREALAADVTKNTPAAPAP